MKKRNELSSESELDQILHAYYRGQVNVYLYDEIGNVFDTDDLELLWWEIIDPVWDEIGRVI